MKIVPHKVEITNAKITPHAGLLPVLEEMGSRRAHSARPLFYKLPAKVVRSGRRLCLKLRQEHLAIYESMMAAVQTLMPMATAPPATA